MSCEWGGDREKPTKFLLNLEKARATKNTIQMVESNSEEMIDQNLSTLYFSGALCNICK